MGDFEPVCALSGVALPHGAPCFWAYTSPAGAVPKTLLWPGVVGSCGRVEVTAEVRAKAQATCRSALPEGIVREPADDLRLLTVHPEAVTRAARLSGAAAEVEAVAAAVRAVVAAAAPDDGDEVIRDVRAGSFWRLDITGAQAEAVAFVMSYLLHVPPGIADDVDTRDAVARACAVWSAASALTGRRGFPFQGCTTAAHHTERQAYLREILSIGAT